jgi:hypothetical protein
MGSEEGIFEEVRQKAFNQLYKLILILNDSTVFDKSPILVKPFDWA